MNIIVRKSRCRSLDTVQQADLSLALAAAKFLRDGKSAFNRGLSFAYLNRACELACAPVHLRPVETAQGVKMAWYSYRPIAQEGPSSDSLPSGIYWTRPCEIEAVILGYESSMTEDEARSRAMGY